MKKIFLLRIERLREQGKSSLLETFFTLLFVRICTICVSLIAPLATNPLQVLVSQHFLVILDITMSFCFIT